MENGVRVPGAGIRLFGIPVRVEVSFFLIVGLIGWNGDAGDLALWVSIAFGSILVHELGHAVAARSFGSPAEIRLYGFGGLTFHEPVGVGRGLVVTLAGPFAGMLVGALVWIAAEAAAPLHGDVRTAAIYALWINVGWGLFNLLPVLPLDGGHALQAVLHLVTGADREAVVRRVSIAVAIGGAVLAYRAGFTLTVLFAAFFVGENLSRLRATAGDERGAAGPHDLFTAVERGDTAQALRDADDVLRDRPDPDVAAAALQAKAWAHLDAHDSDAARAALDALPDGREPSLHLLGLLRLARGDTERGLALVVDGVVQGQGFLPRAMAEQVARAGAIAALADRLVLLEEPAGVAAAAALQAGAHHAQRYEESVTIGRRLHRAASESRPTAAYNVACSLTRLGRTDEALGWLETAVRDGWDDTAQLDADADLEPLRDTSRFRALRAPR